MYEDKRIRRVLLFMPGDSLRKITKGASLGVDSIIMDLEDGVALNNKKEAREVVLHALASGEIEFGDTERLVRVNEAAHGWREEDVAVTIKGKPDGYVLPKVESAREVQEFCHLLMEHELKLGFPLGEIKVLAVIETARGVVAMRDVAQSDQRMVALVFGAEDLAGDIGAMRSAAGMEIFYARSKLIIHAAAFGLQAIDTPFVDLEDMEGLRRETQEAVQMGYTGKLAIHPNQISSILEIFTPSDEDVAAAERLIAAHEDYQANGTGVFVFEGRMVDMPMIRAARRVLDRAKAAGKGYID